MSEKCGQRRTETSVIVDALKPSFKTKKTNKSKLEILEYLGINIFGTVTLPLLVL